MKLILALVLLSYSLEQSSAAFADGVFLINEEPVTTENIQEVVEKVLTRDSDVIFTALNVYGHANQAIDSLNQMLSPFEMQARHGGYVYANGFDITFNFGRDGADRAFAPIFMHDGSKELDVKISGARAKGILPLPSQPTCEVSVTQVLIH